MGFRQIRWASVGRVAAIVAAAIAGILSLPALLGGDAPPPVPPDVGLTQAPIPAAPPAAPQPPAPQSRKQPEPPHSRSRPRPVRRPHHHHPTHAAAGTVTAIPAPAYVPSYPPAPQPSEFQFER
jgi:hypothetical protein